MSFSATASRKAESCQTMEAPKIEPDPNLAAQQQRAQDAQITSLQTEAAADTANLMTRYGTKLALAGSGIPAAAPSTFAAAGGMKAF
jgi:hypothetical protein